MSIIRFDTNIPQELALKYGEGKQVDGQYGAQFLFTLASGDTIYVPPIVAEKIHEAGIQRMETFRICKKEVKEGAKKVIRWEVRKLSETAEPAPQSQPQPALESQLKASIDQVNQQKAQRASASQASPAAQPGPVLIKNEIKNEPDEAHLNAAGQTRLSQLLAGCMTAAIDAAVIARDYAHDKGLTIALSEESIQDLATTLLIHIQRTAELECKYMHQAEIAMNRVQQTGGAAWRQ